MHEVLVNRLGGLSLPRKSVVRLTDRPDMTLDVYRGRKTTMQQQQKSFTVSFDVCESSMCKINCGQLDLHSYKTVVFTVKDLASSCKVLYFKKFCNNTIFMMN